MRAATRIHPHSQHTPYPSLSLLICDDKSKFYFRIYLFSFYFIFFSLLRDLWILMLTWILCLLCTLLMSVCRKRGSERGKRQQLHHDKLTEGFDNCTSYWVNDSWRNDKSSRAAEMNVIKLTTLWQIELAETKSVRNVNKWNVWKRLECAA